MNRKAQAGAGLFLFVLIVAQALTGGTPPPRYALAETCNDGINNDGDFADAPQNTLPMMDYTDNECKIMPFDFGNGEYDGMGLFGNPPQSDIDSYVDAWLQQENLVSHYEMIRYYALEINGFAQGDQCTQQLQDTLIMYRDSYSLPDSMTGVSDHQSECGVSY